MKPETHRKLTGLQQRLKDLGGMIVSFSGGVDSALLLKVARDAVGPGVLAVTAVSETTPLHEQTQARRLAALIGAEHRIVESRELSDPLFTANAPDRCYRCKSHRFLKLLELARKERIPVVVDGTNADDHRDYRPGMKALKELGIRSPLSELGLTKVEIREISRHLALPGWDKPASACLASRIPYHSPITAGKLRQIGEGEDFLRRMGLSGQIRVRHHGPLARLEVEPGELRSLFEEESRVQVAEFFKALGFQYIALDLEGYAMGSLNREVVNRPAGPDAGAAKTGGGHIEKRSDISSHGEK